MRDAATRYWLLRDGDALDDVTLSALTPANSGTVELVRLPGSDGSSPICVRVPYAADPASLAVSRCGDLYLAEPGQNQVAYLDKIGGIRNLMPGIGHAGGGLGQFRAPRGVLVVQSSLLIVADSGNARLQIFRLPTCELYDLWSHAFVNPTGLAQDSANHIYVLDEGLRQVIRFTSQGVPDESYNARLAANQDLASPAYLAIDNQDNLFVTDSISNLLFCFDDKGQPVTIHLPHGAPAPGQPRALAASGHLLYVADAGTGQVWIFDRNIGEYIGTLPGYTGPVAGLAVDEVGALYIRPGADETVYKLEANKNYVSSGFLTAGPIDAGAGSAWTRVHVEAEIPPNTSLTLQVFTADAPTPGPTNPSDWSESAGPDVLLGGRPSNGISALYEPTSSRRYLWLKVTACTDDPCASPKILQVEAATGLDDYRSYLPAVYTREDGPSGLLRRWLSLFSVQLGDIEELLDTMPRRFDPYTAPEDGLSWLADWLAFEPPTGISGDDLRQLLLRAHDLYTRRGTPAGLREFIKVYTGADAQIFEAYRERHIWQLGESSASRLGLDTALAAALPDGMIVPGFDRADPSYTGLRGDYYHGISFGEYAFTKLDPTINYATHRLRPGHHRWPDDVYNLKSFSVRWTGQVQTRYTETYTFSTLSDDGLRLWVDGRLLIDNWNDHALVEDSAAIALEAGRWYPIQVEFYQHHGDAAVALYWSSRSQRKEIVPHHWLYSVLDESANLTPLPAHYPESETLLVGQAVVGGSGPLAPSEFGMPLFLDTAHLFTVLLPAACVPSPEQQQTLRSVIDAEKPAHTDYQLCLVEPRMRVGCQASIGIDSIVAGPPDAMSMEGTVLGLDSYLGAAEGDGSAGRIGKQATLGVDTLIG